MECKMTPKSPNNNPDLFRLRLDNILNTDHELCQLADKIDWGRIEAELADCYSPDMGRPGSATRLLVGLHYLKHAFDESDESVLARWVENPYWQYFCGFLYMQHDCPIHPTTMVKWRQRVGAERMEVLVCETLATALREKYLTVSQAEKITADTTVQEKAIAYPTDARLYFKMLRRLVKLAKVRNLVLRQSYVRVSKRALTRQGRYAHARQFKRAQRQTRKLKVYLGRVVRDIHRKAPQMDEELVTYLERSDRLLRQQRDSSNKLYSIDAPEVECISKGKAHKRYEFGCKVAVAVTNRGNWIVASRAMHGNPYDGHTLSGTVAQAERWLARSVREIFVDRGYRGHDYEGSAVVYQVGCVAKSITRTLREKLRRRSAIEPTISHLKQDNRLERNHLKGHEGDRLHAVLCAAGYNLRKLLSAFLRAAWKWLFQVIGLRIRTLLNPTEPALETPISLQCRLFQG